MKLIIELLSLFIFLHSSADGNAEHNKCAPRSYGLNRIVCVCNSSYCDTLPESPDVPIGQYVSYTSSQSGLRFKMASGQMQDITNDIQVDNEIIIDTNTKYQTIIGWGGAFTDSTGININSLDFNAANHLMRSYFSKAGLEYNLCRVPIGGTDFSTHGYSYNDGESDPELSRYKLAPEDFKYKIPLIKAAKEMSNDTLELFASAWTAPRWMKYNGEYTGPDFLKTEMYQSWANYFVKFLELYKKEGIEFWGITTGNEPSTGLLPMKINSVGWFPWQMSTWIVQNLGPTLRNSEFSAIKIITIDDQIFYYPHVINEIFKNAEVHNYVDGFGLHWYWNKVFTYNLLTKTHDKYPNKFILATEACTGTDTYKHVILGEWWRGESYAYDIINDLNNWVTGWVDWNMALNEIGGPTYIANYVDSPIIVNSTGGEFYKQPMYYALGHFSKFVPKGSTRVLASQSVAIEKFEYIAFQRPDNKTSVILINRNEKEVSIKLTDHTREIIETIPPRSIMTFLYT